MVISNNNKVKNSKSPSRKRSSSAAKVASKDSSVSDNSVTDSFRPRNFKDIIGRSKEKKTLNIMIQAAQQRGEALDHILFYGPPGLGKTTFAMSIANEIGTNIRITSGPVIERQADLAAILTNLKKGDILFIDEIHRLSKTVEEMLYPVMEDGVIDIVMGKGPSAKSIRLSLEPFTLIGATTQIGRIGSPMRDRFGYIRRLDYFSNEEAEKIVKRAASISGINITSDAVAAIAKRSRGTGRVVLRLFKRIRDYHESESGKKSDGEITLITALKALELIGVDELGLEEIDRKILHVIYNQFDGGPVGLSTISAAISEDSSTIEDVYEPFLMKLGLIKRTTRGRIITEKGAQVISGNLLIDN
ncbi:Holliday junction branch migration DNA helicase RuvB [Candidatus Nomurabacteria bacterium]|nr:Holliday junction branch migration DNA helicase RuvB [Candidatus Nomurabacteria bacterium]